MESTSKKTIYHGNSIISVEVAPDYSHPVVVKRPSKHHRSRQDIRSLDNEYAMTRALEGVEGVRQAVGRRLIENQSALILEYIDGESLRDHIARKPLSLHSRLEIAIELTRILGRVHQQDVIHLDLNSGNILIGEKEHRVHIIDLGAAFRIGGNGYPRVRHDQILGSVPYISPEQTGRINRVVDERSDLYSLGVVLYELMTHRLPFDSKDPAEVIHQHITRTPVSPSHLSSEIPEMISMIVQKLLEKNADDRYQSAAGVRADLEKCLQRLKPDNTIEAFRLGKADHTRRFKYPQRLYGRESELKVLESAFENASREASSMLFVSGYSGVGKTALVEEIQRRVSEGHGNFVGGKFDQYVSTIPYAGIAQAFDVLVSQILAEPEDVFSEWQSKVRAAVGDLGKVLTDIMPGIEELIGTQPDVPRLGGQDAENSLHYVFMNFLSAVATIDHPLAFFIDDLQWIDAASLRLLEVIQCEFNQPGLLVVGAYRHNEVDALHPLARFVGNGEEHGMPIRILKLDDLQMQHVEALLSDALQSLEGIEELGATIHDKTRGNPFFIRRLLISLNEEGRIHYDAEIKSWKWDIAEIGAEAIADNVADLLTESIAHLPKETAEVLTLAACIGNRFDIPTLAVISDREEQDIIELLTGPLSRQYVSKSGDSYEFVHDQVQQAAYQLIDARSRIKKHLKNGRLLLADTDESELEVRIFDIVGQYNQGADLLTDRDERKRLAELNLQAGRKAKYSSAYSAYAEYMKRSASLLPEEAWREQYHLMLDIHNEWIQACLLSIQYQEVEILFGKILEHGKQAVDLWIAYKTLITACGARHELGRAISLAESYLEQLEITLDSERESDLSIPELYELPQMEDEEKLAAMEILMEIISSVRFSEPERVPSVVYTMLNLISRYGNSRVSGAAYAQYSMILCINQQYQEGNRFGQLAVDLCGKYPHLGRTVEIMNMQYSNIRPWLQPIHDLIIPLKTHHRTAMQTGNFEWGMYCLLNYTLLLCESGEPLEHCLAEAEAAISLCHNKKQQFSLQVALMFAEFLLNLTGKSSAVTRLEGKWFSEETMMSRLSGNQMLLAFYGLLKMRLHYLFGDPGAAYRQTQDVLKYRGSLNPLHLYTKISFYGALSCIAGLPDAESDADQQERVENLRLFEEEMALWAESAPMNYQHEYDLLQAEKSRVASDRWKAAEFYERAIKGAKENRFVHEEALANELCGKFWRESGNDRIAGMYMREAHMLYRQWVADAKVAHLEEFYPDYFKAQTPPSGHLDTPGQLRATVSQPITPVQMDLDGIIGASQILSSETSLDRLMTRMTELVMSNSGADNAVLLVRQGENWLVQAHGDVATKESDILLNRRFDPGDGDSETELVPEPVFQYCCRSEDVLVVADARQDHRFSKDRLIRARDVKSIACIPAKLHGELNAMLYLENCQMTGVFTLGNVAVIKHLAGQFAISVENALLYDSVRQKISDLRTSQERYELAVAGSAAGIWDWDLITNELYTSGRTKELVGYAPAELSITMDNFWGWIHPDDTQSVQTAINEHLKQRALYRIDYRLRTKSGEYRWFHARGQAIWDETGNATRMSGSLTDITPRKQAEQKLTSSEERFRKLMEQSPLAIEILSPEGQITEVNTAWKRLWGATEDEAAQTVAKYNMLTDPQLERLGVSTFVERAFAGEPVVLPPIQYSAAQAAEEVVGFENPELRSPWIQSHLYPVKDANGEIEYVVNTYMDITETKRAEQETREQRDALARMDRTTSMGQLTGSIAHELNQPLTGILSNSQAAELMIKGGKWKVNEWEEIMADIIEDAKRAGDVIRSLRELYREQKGEFLPVDVSAVITETEHLFHSEFVLQSVSLTIKCAPSIPVLNGNKVQIQQVLVNLIANGIQAVRSLAENERRLHVEAAYDTNNVKVWVEDCGPGIDADRIERVFEPLATWKPGGTGMGLAVSNSIINAHGGTMFAENNPDGGARVGFVIPVLEKGGKV